MSSELVSEMEALNIAIWKLVETVYNEGNKSNSRKTGRQYCIISLYSKDMPLLSHGDILNRSNNSVLITLWKSIEIGKSLISFGDHEFEWNPKRLIIRTLPPNVRFNVPKHLFGCKLDLASTIICNWFLFTLQ